MGKIRLILLDGTQYEGESFGADIKEPIYGEVVFNTGMYGYQETITNPSYAGQFVCFTYPHIGNYGCNLQDMESDRVRARAVIIKNLSIVTSSFRSEESLESLLKRNNVVGICNLNTRALVQHIRDVGTQMAAIVPSEVTTVVSVPQVNKIDKVSCKEQFMWDELPWNITENSYKKLSANKMWSRPHLVVIDCGVKRSILRTLLQVGFRITVVPWDYSKEQILAQNPDALFISNGPDNPENYQATIETLKNMLGSLPILAVSLGHQILALAMGAKTFKLKVGQHGGQSVKNQLLGTVENPAHETCYAVELESLPKGVKVSHINVNDNSIAGLECPALKTMSYQYIPVDVVGPQGVQSSYEKFFEMVVGYKNNAA